MVFMTSGVINDTTNSSVWSLPGGNQIPIGEETKDWGIAYSYCETDGYPLYLEISIIEKG